MDQNKENLEKLNTSSIYDIFEKSDDIFTKAEVFSHIFDEMKNRGEYSYRRALLNGNRNRVKIFDDLTGKEKEMLMFASNNYLGLATDARVIKEVIKATEIYGYGTGSVALFSGTTDLHKALEEKIAEFYKAEAATLFPTGYQANVGTIQAFLMNGDIAIADMYSHASIIDGVNLSDGHLKYFQHNDMENLERILKKAEKRFNGKLIVTDGVFSMDGDFSPLNQILPLTRKYGARVLVDEAHSLGIIGKTGKGTPEHCGVEGEVDLVIGTLSKAASGIGGYLAGTKKVVEFARHFGRSYIFSTSIPTPIVAGLLKVFEIIEQDQEIHLNLRKNIDYMLKNLHGMGFDTLDSNTAIIPVMIPDEDKLRLVCKALHEKGIFANAVTFPAVAMGKSRIRVSVMATHTREDLDYFLNNLKEMKDEYKLNQ